MTAVTEQMKVSHCLHVLLFWEYKFYKNIDTGKICYSELCHVVITNHNMNFFIDKQTQTSTLQWYENVVYGLGQAHRCGGGKLVADEKNDTDI